MQPDKRHNLARILAIVLCGGGAWVSGRLVERHAAIWSATSPDNGPFAWLCAAAGSVGLDCSAAQRSPWSEIRIPIPLPTLDLGLATHVVVMPIAFIGLAYFVFLGIWLFFVGLPRRSGERWERVPLVLTLLGGLASILFIAVMFLGVSPGCGACLAVHLLNIALAAIIWRMSRSADAIPCHAAPRMIPAFRGARHATIFALIVIGGLWLFRREQIAMGSRIQSLAPYKATVDALRGDPEFLLYDYRTQEPRRIPARGGDNLAIDRPRLVVFTDFTCSICACNAVRIHDQIKPAFAGTLDVDIRHFPNAGQCSDEQPSPACLAAYAAEAARAQGGDDAFRIMHDTLFRNRNRLAEPILIDIARSIGLDVDRFRQDINAPDTHRVVADDIALARRLGVVGTPTMFLEGRAVSPFGRDNPLFWRAVADDWIASHGATTAAAEP